MPEIALANDVTIEYGHEDVDVGSWYKFTENVPDLGDFATQGTTFKLLTRQENEGDGGSFIYKFKTEDAIEFKLVENTFAKLLENDVVIIDD